MNIRIITSDTEGGEQVNTFCQESEMYMPKAPAGTVLSALISWNDIVNRVVALTPSDPPLTPHPPHPPSFSFFLLFNSHG